MDESAAWHPSKDEVAHIVEELRPIIDEIARRDEQTMVAEQWRRDHVLA